MKKVLAILLVVAMMAGVLPALTFTAMADGETTQPGLTAEAWLFRGEHNTSEVYRHLIGSDSGDNARCSFDDTQRFDASIERLKKASTIHEPVTNVTEFPGVLEGRDGYMYHWTGTMTSATGGTYWFAAKKIDNGFVAVVNGERKYEYWASHHWFNGDNDFLISNNGSFTLKAGEVVDVELWYLETNGGEGLDVGVVTAENAARDTMQSLADAGITLNLTKEVWYTDIAWGDNEHNKIKDAIPNAGVNDAGVPQTDGNGCPAWRSENHQYDTSIDGIKAAMTKLEGSVVLPNYELSNLDKFNTPFKALSGYFKDDFLVEYNGYVTPSISGTYEFGTRRVDNCLMVEITDEETGETMRVYEFWAKNIWNDADTTWSQNPVELEAGKSYKIHVAFLEINGGEAIESRIKINGKEKMMAESGLFFTVEKPVEAEVYHFFEESDSITWHYKTSGTNNTEQIRDNAWMTDSDVYGAWETHTGGFSSKDNSWPTEKDVGDLDSGKNHQSLWAVTEFNVEDATALNDYAIAVGMAWDDNIRVYINGNLVMVDTGWSNEADGVPVTVLTDSAKGILKTGKNTLAVKLVQGYGGASFNLNRLFTIRDVGKRAQDFYNIADKQDLLDFAAEANRIGDSNKTMIANLTADIDMTGETWTPINRWLGKFYGNGHTIKGLSYETTAEAPFLNEKKEPVNDGKPIGLMFTSITNNNANGRVYDLILEDCKLTVHATEGDGKEQQVIAGILAGIVDRGFVENVTVKGCTIDGNPGIAGGIAGVVCWKTDNKGNHVENCATLDSTVTATHLAAGIVAYLRGGDDITIGNMEVSGVNFVTEGQYSNGIGAKWGWGERDPHITSEEYENNTSKVTLGLDDGENYQFYSQTRKGSEDNTTDVRVVAVVKLEWLEAAAKANVKISFTNTEGSNTKSTGELSLQKVYQLLNAQNLSAQEMAYVAEEGIVILGWIITGVDNDYVNGLHVDMITQ